MTRYEIIKANERIAEFMKVERERDGGLYYINDHPQMFASCWVTAAGLRYNASWDWLIPVIEKIEEGNYGFKMCRKRVEVFFDDTKQTVLTVKEKSRLESAYKAVVTFLFTLDGSGGSKPAYDVKEWSDKKL